MKGVAGTHAPKSRDCDLEFSDHLGQMLRYDEIPVYKTDFRVVLEEELGRSVLVIRIFTSPTATRRTGNRGRQEMRK
jgi:hypothetical protein